ncbi:MAG TPA: general secretion pathway protein GspB [Steroidobacteraceae bacterium]|nr:general secretion pathway protein GspB [Steroidobacteraceae bacterium]
MSFILDALKKSESDRQRQSGPALYEVKVAPPRNGLPLWAVGLAVLLAVNLVIVAWVLLRRSPEPAAGQAAAGTVPFAGAQGTGPAGVPGAAYAPGAGTGAQTGAGQTPGPQTMAAPMPGAQAMTGPGLSPQGSPQQGWAHQPGWAQQPGGPLAGTAYPGSAPSGAYPGTWGAANPTVPQGQMPGNAVPANGMMPNTPPGQAAAGPTPPAQWSQASSSQQLAGSPPQGTNEASPAGGEKLTPDDYAPAADPGPMPAFGNHVARSTASGVPLYQDAALAPGAHIPELRLDLHVFATKPQERFVMINMHKLHEGDTLQAEGVHVESITPEGVVLSKDGTRFLLPRD